MEKPDQFRARGVACVDVVEAAELLRLREENAKLRAENQHLRANPPTRTVDAVPVFLSIKQPVTPPTSEGETESSTPECGSNYGNDSSFADEISRALLCAQTRSLATSGDAAETPPDSPMTIAVVSAALPTQLVDATEASAQGCIAVVPPPPEPVAPRPCASLGSRGHPHGCGAACKFFWKRGGCKDGAQCERCHMCPWVRNAAGKEPPSPSRPQPPPPGLRERSPLRVAVAAAPTPTREAAGSSLGSVGHAAGGCGPPCRYVRRKEGCREGWKCQMCHICHWARRAGDKERICCAEQYTPGKLLISCVYLEGQQ